MKDQLNSLSVAYLERLYADYVDDPSQVPPEWRRYFERMANGNGRVGHVSLRPSFRPESIFHPAAETDGRRAGDALAAARFQDRVEQLVWNYRLQGHLIAELDPLGTSRPDVPELTPEFYGLTPTDRDRPLLIQPLFGPPAHTLGQLLERLRHTYCRFIGAEFMHIRDLAVRQWLERRMEESENRLALSRQAKLHFLRRLTDAQMFDEFVLKRYIGAKVFSLEGTEILIPLLDLAIEKAAEQGIVQIVMGMAHRGRLNVLANILGKSPRRIFREFEDKFPTLHRGGDVKYHLGHSNDWIAANGRKMRLTLCFNPSHLEFVNPVAEGSLRAKLDRAGDVRIEQGLVILIHGDAAFAGEGIVQETLNLSQLPAYTTGGTLHIIVNNQIGFTTTPREGRSGVYASDVAKMLEIPIFHVNGEEPEAVAQTLALATDFRREFRRDVVIDLYCYRRHGHNEGDEPEFTQPLQSAKIRSRKSIRENYYQRLLAEREVTPEEAAAMARQCQEKLEREYVQSQSVEASGPSHELSDVWRGYRAGREATDEKVNTAVPRQQLAALLERLAQVPDDFHLHPKLQRWLARRREMAAGAQPLDWSAAEALALATLAVDGYRIRLSGQDSARGTFSQRHAVLYDVEDGHRYAPLEHVAADQAPVETINSPLSEAGALGYEYGYSLDYPDCLVAWEAQFGDFSNAAQVIIDQFITSAEEKWSHLSGIALLLPHGFEGQGPEHSSARLERFLNLSTEDNIQVVVPTTPAQYFHCLRRQMLRRWLKPLVLMTPKSLLRHPRAVSSLDECAHDRFHRVLPDSEISGGTVQRILLCSGKIYYELLARREELGRRDVAIIRVEQLYPLPAARLLAVLEAYAPSAPVCWVQEEPANMGAGPFFKHWFYDQILQRHPFQMIARYRSASPATGSLGIHRQEQERLLGEAIGSA